jgi:hypothetical protein
MRLATVPDAHPYLDAVIPAGVTRVRLSTDDDDPWALSPAWDPAVLLGNGIDVLHVHFGYDAVPVDEMRAWARQMTAGPTAVVVTVHDLRNPHHLDPAVHDAHLGALLGVAHEVITLTPGAAEVIATRWGRRATVLPHPSFQPATAPARAPGRTVGLHLKGLRRNVIEPDRLVRAIARGARSAGGRLRVDLHPDVVDRPELSDTLAAGARGDIDLRVHPRFDDRQLEQYLREVDVSVLPYRFGTHSGWLELCRDLGTAVVVPDCGFYAEQWPGANVFANNESTGLDEASLARAVHDALVGPRPEPADPQVRRAERELIRARHSDIYARAATHTLAGVG